MKKSALTLIALFTILTITAQVVIKPVVKAGLNFSNFTDSKLLDDGNELKNLTSFHLGAGVNFKFSNIYTLSPEISYSEQGSKMGHFFKGFNQRDQTISYQKAELDIKVNYLSIVANNKFYPGGKGFNLQIAPVIDILINHKNITAPQGFDFAIMGGLGYDFPFGLTVDARFKQGIVDVFGLNVNNGNGAQTTDFRDLTLNQTFQISFGYQFKL